MEQSVRIELCLGMIQSNRKSEENRDNFLNFKKNRASGGHPPVT